MASGISIIFDHVLRSTSKTPKNRKGVFIGQIYNPCGQETISLKVPGLNRDVTGSREEYNSQYSMDDSILGIIWIGQVVLQVVNTVQLAMLMERK